MSCPGLVSYPFAMGFCQSWETYFSTVITVDVIIQTVGEARRGKVWRLENDCRNPRAILLCDNFPTTHPTTSSIIRSTPLAVHYNVSKIYRVGGSISLGLLSQIEPFFSCLRVLILILISTVRCSYNRYIQRSNPIHPSHPTYSITVLHPSEMALLAPKVL